VDVRKLAALSIRSSLKITYQLHRVRRVPACKRSTVAVRAKYDVNSSIAGGHGRFESNGLLLPSVRSRVGQDPSGLQTAVSGRDTDIDGDEDQQCRVGVVLPKIIGASGTWPGRLIRHPVAMAIAMCNFG
jgi:hypothetical protein